MNFEKTMDYFYNDCSNRTNLKIAEIKKIDKKFRQEDILPNNKGLVSKLVNCRKDSNNPYLLTDSLIYGDCRNQAVKTGLINVLKFDNLYEILWGTEQNIRNNSEIIFFNIIEDLLNFKHKKTKSKKSNQKKCDYKQVVENLLVAYIPYSRDITYKQILTDYHGSSIRNYGVARHKIYANTKKSKEMAIEYIYLECNKDRVFEDLFCEFICDFPSYFDFINKLENFVETLFIPLLLKSISLEKTLGFRVKNLIEEDVSQSEQLILAHNNNEKLEDSEYKRALISAATKYIVELEKVQMIYIDSLRETNKRSKILKNI